MRTTSRINVIGPLILEFCLLSKAAFAAPTIITVDQREGLPRITLGGASVMSSQFVFWGANWKWEGLQTRFTVVAPFEYATSGANRALGFGLSTHIKKSLDRQLVWTFDFDAATATPNVIGGGISFRFDLADFGERFGDPQILPNNTGWVWGRQGETQIEMRCDHPLADVFFERGHKSEVRAFFYKGSIPAGRQHVVCTFTISGDAIIGPSVAERFGPDNDPAWPTNVVDWTVSPVDLSFLNAPERPAGKHGFLKVAGDKLLFSDGTQARFWGTNLVANSLFGTLNHENAKRQAQRLSELGFNLVRLHHIDSDWVQPNVFGKGAPDTQKLDETSLDRLDWWIKCLEDEGIYVWLDLHDGRRLTAGDHIDDFAEISKGKPSVDLKGYNYINASIQKAMQRFDEAFLNHFNRYNGHRYKDDPGIAAILITNENDLTHHFGNIFLPDKNVPHEDALYMAQAAAFAEKTGLPKDKTWRSWEPGPSKIFLNDLEHAFNAKMIDELRALGVKAPVATTNTWGDNPISSLPALTDGDIIDAHSYGAVGELEANPLYAANLVDWIAAAQIADRPLSATEWNVSPFPTPDRDVIPLYIAGTADLQGWDALMQFAYSQQGLDRPGRAGNWDAYIDPALLATLPAAALLYRRHDAQEARTTYVFAPPEAQFFGQAISPDHSVALRTAAERGRLVIAIPHTPELPWLKASQIPPDAKVVSDPQQSLLPNDADEAVSDTGEITRNWQQGIYKIDTPRTQAAMGWIGGKTIELSDVEINVSTRNATVSVQSLDNDPVNMSTSLLISLGARSIPNANGTMFHSEPVVGHLTIRAKPGLKFYKRIGGVQMPAKVQATYTNGRYDIALGPDLGTYWLIMK